MVDVVWVMGEWMLMLSEVGCVCVVVVEYGVFEFEFVV